MFANFTHGTWSTECLRTVYAFKEYEAKKEIRKARNEFTERTESWRLHDVSDESDVDCCLGEVGTVAPSSCMRCNSAWR